jgi:phosphate-selective porin OprO/OprP
VEAGLMQKKVYKSIAKQIAGSVALLSIVASGNAIADVMVVKKSSKSSRQEHTLPRTNNVRRSNSEEFAPKNSLRLTSTGGLLYGDPDKDSCWFHVSGVARLDEALFMGSYRDTGFGVSNPVTSLPSGANLRAAQLFVDGGFAPCWEFTLGIDFSGTFNNFKNNVITNTRRGSVYGARFLDSWIAYSGFAENNEVFFGRVSGNWFGIDGSNSTTWMAFMERSLQAVAFYPGDGLGLMTDWWWCDGAFTFVAFQPDQGQRDLDNFSRDRWAILARATYAPVHCEGDVWHFGVSGAWKEASSDPFDNRLNRIGFETRPGIRARRTPYLLQTDTIALANNVRMFNVEFARQYGPLMLEAEYTNAYVHRAPGLGTVDAAAASLGSLRFHGYNVQARYMLTGESHAYDVRDGAFGTVKPNGCFGAWEIAARYDYVNLNDKDIFGGVQHNASFALNWFINQHVRLSANYIRANIHPRRDDVRRYVDMLGFRAQFRFK